MLNINLILPSIHFVLDLCQVSLSTFNAYNKRPGSSIAAGAILALSPWITKQNILISVLHHTKSQCKYSQFQCSFHFCLICHVNFLHSPMLKYSMKIYINSSKLKISTYLNCKSTHKVRKCKQYWDAQSILYPYILLH